jgi:hypothetical protein
MPEEKTVDEVLEPIWAILSGTPHRWRNLIESLPEPLSRCPPAPGEWSPVECLNHLCDADRDYFSIRVQVFLAGGTIVPINPGESASHETASPAQVLAEFERLRDQSLLVLKGLTDGDLTRTADHPEYGSVQLGEMLHEWAAHDLSHTIQAERALMQPFIAASGPWRWTFGNHDLTVDRAE